MPGDIGLARWFVGADGRQSCTDREGAASVLHAMGADVGDLEDLEARAYQQ